MSLHQVKADRATLYEEVWTTPVSRLAERYGISDVDLTPLRRTLYLQPPASASVSEIPASLRSVAASVAVADALRHPDPFVARTRDTLKEQLRTWRPDHHAYARVSPCETGTINIHVCPSSISRAVRLLDAVVKGARRAGFEVSAGPRDSERDVHFVIEGEEVPFLLREPMRQERIELPKGKRHGSRYEFKYHPTGRLTLELANKWHVPRHTWRDTERQRLEDLVGSFLLGAYRAAGVYRERRLEAERRRREERLRAEEERRLERLRTEDAERERQLEVQVQRWRRSLEVAAFVDEIERQAQEASMTEGKREALKVWLEWARHHALRLDPFSGGVVTLLSRL